MPTPNVPAAASCSMRSCPKVRITMVIRDHHVVAVLPIERGCGRERGADAFTECDNSIVGGYEGQSCMLRDKYGIVPLPAETWSQEAWAKLAIERYLEEERKRQNEAVTYGMTPEQKSSFFYRQYLNVSLKEEGFARRIFSIVPAEEVAP